MTKFTDQLGRTFQIDKTPEKIVSLVPSQTELLVDIGLRQRITGITKFCVHPPELRKEKKIVGGTKSVHFDKIQDIKPDIILCNKEENTEEMVLELEKIAAVHVSDIQNLEDTFEMIRMYGSLFQVEEKASKIIGMIQYEFAEFQKFLQQKEKRRVAYFIWKKPWMVAGKDTFIDYLLQLNNFENVFLNKEGRYPEISLKELKEKHPDEIFLSSEPFPFKEKHKAALEEDFPSTRIQIVDGEYFSWYGSRLTKAFSYFKTLHK